MWFDFFWESVRRGLGVVGGEVDAFRGEVGEEGGGGFLVLLGILRVAVSRFGGEDWREKRELTSLFGNERVIS